MPRAQDRFLSQLRGTFIVEAREHLQALGEGLMALEKAQDAEARRPLVETVFRAAHSLKGAARSVDLREIEARCQALEDLFSPWNRGQASPTPASLDQAHRFLNQLSAAVGEIAPATAASPSSEPARAPPPPAAKPAAETVRVDVAKLDARLATAEQMVTVKLTAARRAEELQEVASWFEDWRRQWQRVEGRASTLRHARDRHGAAADGSDALLEFLDWNLDHMRRLEARLGTLAHAARQDGRMVAQLVDEMLDESKRLLLTPFAGITAPLRKLVRDLSREQGKDAELQVVGDEVEIDRRVLEAMKDPLVHIVRNSVDHGIEPPEARARAGKPARATIILSITRVDAGKVVLRVEDDGRGIDPERVRAAAVERGLLSLDEARALEDAAARDLVFRSGFTTSAAVTRVSGRGLGLAIVREKAERLGGDVDVTGRPGGGTAFVMTLPTMLAIYRGLLVEAAGEVFVAPSAHVERVARIRADEVRPVEGRATVPIDGRVVPLVALADVLELRGARREPGPTLNVMVVGVGDQRIAFVVDEILDVLEVLAKPLTPPLVRVRNVSGATVAGSGALLPILNAPDLLKSARRVPRPAAAARVAGASKSILVAEDSITSRLLLKGILEGAGYSVKSAADGMEAFALLRSHPFDLVVSDVDMPRLNGFGLTARVRADSRLASLPVVLLTTLASEEDRERGFDAGANAYIVKSRFDQGELLDTIRRLV